MEAGGSSMVAGADWPRGRSQAKLSFHILFLSFSAKAACIRERMQGEPQADMSEGDVSASPW